MEMEMGMEMVMGMGMEMVMENVMVMTVVCDDTVVDGLDNNLYYISLVDACWDGDGDGDGDGYHL